MKKKIKQLPKKRILPICDIGKKPRLKVRKDLREDCITMSQEILDMFRKANEAEMMDYDFEAINYVSQFIASYILGLAEYCQTGQPNMKHTDGGGK